MKLWVNNKETISTAATLRLLADELSLPEKGIAMAVDNKMVPRADWDGFALSDGMHIIIIKAVCGG